MAGGRQCIDVVDVELVEFRGDALVETIGLEKSAIGCSRRCEATGHPDSETAQVCDHLPERSVFAADDLDVMHPKLFELDDIRLQSLLPCVPLQEMDNRSRVDLTTALPVDDAIGNFRR